MPLSFGLHNYPRPVGLWQDHLLEFDGTRASRAAPHTYVYNCRVFARIKVPNESDEKSRAMITLYRTPVGGSSIPIMSLECYRHHPLAYSQQVANRVVIDAGDVIDCGVTGPGVIIEELTITVELSRDMIKTQPCCSIV